MCQSLKNKNIHVTFDNFFTSYVLVDKLFAEGIYATATVRSNRIDLPLLARQRPDMTRGEYKWRTKNHTSYIQWKDTKHVHLLSTAFSPTTVTETSRRLRTGETIQVPRPSAVKQYTRRMGGVDRFDQQRGSYSVSRRSRRWWIRIFYFLVDTAIVNAHILHGAVHPDNCSTQLQFRVILFRALIGSFSSRRRSTAAVNFVRRRRRHKADMKPTGVPDNIRMESIGVHMPAELPNYRRCRLCSTRTNNKRSRIQCATCLVPLCIVPCFSKFHKKA